MKAQFANQKTNYQIAAMVCNLEIKSGLILRVFLGLLMREDTRNRERMGHHGVRKWRLGFFSKIPIVESSSYENSQDKGFQTGNS